MAEQVAAQAAAQVATAKQMEAAARRGETAAEQVAALQMSLDSVEASDSEEELVTAAKRAARTEFIVEGRAKEATPENAVVCQAMASARRAVAVARQAVAVAVAAEKIVAATGDAEVAVAELGSAQASNSDVLLGQAAESKAAIEEVQHRPMAASG